MEVLRTFENFSSFCWNGTKTERNLLLLPELELVTELVTFEMELSTSLHTRTSLPTSQRPFISEVPDATNKLRLRALEGRRVSSKRYSRVRYQD